MSSPLHFFAVPVGNDFMSAASTLAKCVNLISIYLNFISQNLVRNRSKLWTISFLTKVQLQYISAQHSIYTSITFLSRLTLFLPLHVYVHTSTHPHFHTFTHPHTPISIPPHTHTHPPIHTPTHPHLHTHPPTPPQSKPRRNGS